mgnify:FL=1
MLVRFSEREPKHQALDRNSRASLRRRRELRCGCNCGDSAVQAVLPEPLRGGWAFASAEGQTRIGIGAFGRRCPPRRSAADRTPKTALGSTAAEGHALLDKFSALFGASWAAGGAAADGEHASSAVKPASVGGPAGEASTWGPASAENQSARPRRYCQGAPSGETSTARCSWATGNWAGGPHRDTSSDAFRARRTACEAHGAATSGGEHGVGVGRLTAAACPAAASKDREADERLAQRSSVA